MKDKQIKGSDQMMDFILNKLDAEDQATSAMLRPLPANVLPSEQFLHKTRVHLLSVTAATVDQRAA